jgi:hypothetical protein
MSISSDIWKALSNPLAFLGRKTGDARDLREPKDFSKFVDELYDQAKKERREAEAEWHYNVAYVLGEQYVEYNQDLGAVVKMPLPEYRVRHTCNLISAAMQRDVAKTTKRPANIDVIPVTDSDTDSEGARLCKQVIDAKFQELHMDLLFQELKMWSATCGVAFMKVFWDPDAGEPFVDHDGNERDAYIGDVYAEVVRPFYVYYDPGARHLGEASWLIQAEMRPVGWAVERWPDKADEILKSAESASSEQNMANLATVTLDYAPESKMVMVKEFWSKPQRRAKDGWRKDGCYAVVVGDVVVDGPKKFPYKSGKIPYVELKSGWLPGLSRHGTSVVKQLIPIQTEYNRLWSIMIESGIKMGCPKWWVPRGCGVDENSFTDEPGEIIRGNAGPNGEGPTALKIQETHPYTFERMADRHLGDFDNVSGQHEVSRGQVPGSVTSGVAIDLLQEQDDTMLGPPTRRYEVFQEEVARRLLELYKEHSDGDQRELLLYSGRGDYNRISFRGKDLRYAKIRIEPGSLKPTSRAALQAQILEYYKAGLFGPYQDPHHEEISRSVLQLLEFGHMETYQDELNADRKRARLENEALDGAPMTAEEGVEVYVRPFDGHDEHIKAHRRRQKDPSYEDLSEQAKAAYENHIADHQMFKTYDQAFLQKHINEALIRLGMDPQVPPEMSDMARDIMRQKAAAALGGQGDPASQQGQPPMGAEMPPGAPPGAVSAPDQMAMAQMAQGAGGMMPPGGGGMPGGNIPFGV